MKVGIIISGGGHLDEALQVMDAFKGKNVFLATYYQKSLLAYRHGEIDKVYFMKLIRTSGWGFILSIVVHIFQFLKVFIIERPDVLFSTGSEIAIVPFYLGKFLFGTRLIFLETVTRVSSPSFTAKMLYPVTDLFLVQWEDMLRIGPKARFAGRVI